MDPRFMPGHRRGTAEPGIPPSHAPDAFSEGTRQDGHHQHSAAWGADRFYGPQASYDGIRQSYRHPHLTSWGPDGFYGPQMPSGVIVQGGHRTYSTGWGPDRIDWQPNGQARNSSSSIGLEAHSPFQMHGDFAMPSLPPRYYNPVPYAPTFARPSVSDNIHARTLESGSPYTANHDANALFPTDSRSPPSKFTPLVPSAFHQGAPVGSNKRTRPDDDHGSFYTSRPPPRRQVSEDELSHPPDHEEDQPDNESEHDSPPTAHIQFALSHETTDYMERMRSTIEGLMKSVLKDSFESSELRAIFTKDFKNRCFAAIERGDFVPNESFMCSTGVKGLRDMTLAQALTSGRKSRQAESCRAIARGRTLFTSDFTNGVPLNASHLCHQRLYDLFWHILAEAARNNVGRNGCISKLKHAVANGGSFPLDRCWCFNAPHCLLGPAALNDEEVMTYQWMAANNYASSSEIPLHDLAGMATLPIETLNAVFTTWKVEIQQGDDGHKSAWAVPVTQRRLRDIWLQRVNDSVNGPRRDLAKNAGDSVPDDFEADDDSEATDDSNVSQPEQQSEDDIPRRRQPLRGSKKSQLRAAISESPSSAPALAYSVQTDVKFQDTVRALVLRRKANRFEVEDGRDQDPSVTEALSSELAACQTECIRRFIKSSAGRKMIQENADMNTWGRGSDRTGMQCILESTIYYQLTDPETRNPSQAGEPIKKGAYDWLMHMRHHREWEDSVLCRAILFMLDNCKWIEERMSSKKRRAMEEVRNGLREGRLPTTAVLNQFMISKSGV